MPFRIVNNLPKSDNLIARVFALPNGTFVILTENRANNITILYQFNDELQWLDSTSIEGFYYSYPTIDKDGSFILIGENYRASVPGVYAVKLDVNLKKISKRNITLFYPNPSGHNRYYNQITRLSNGKYIIACTYELFPDLKDKVVKFCVNDIFNDNTTIWLDNPSSYNGEWIETVEPMSDKYNNFYTASTDHLRYTSNFLSKFDSTGKIIWSKMFPFTHDRYNMYIKDDKVIYQDFEYFYMFDSDGNLLLQEPIINGDQLSSSLIPTDNNWYYAINFFNTDGNFIQFRKSDATFKTVKSQNFGNRGVNIGNYINPFLIRLTSGKLLSVVLVKNPDQSGNHWLLQKTDLDLEPEK